MQPDRGVWIPPDLLPLGRRHYRHAVQRRRWAGPAQIPAAEPDETVRCSLRHLPAVAVVRPAAAAIRAIAPSGRYPVPGRDYSGTTPCRARVPPDGEPLQYRRGSAPAIAVR